MNEFKAWDIDNKCWLTDKEQVFLDNKGNAYILPDGIFGDFKLVNVDICFWTGKIDKNGIKIYKGDIVKLTTNFLKYAKEEEPKDFSTYTYSVKYFDGMFALSRGLPFNNGFVKNGILEVIGNIYENKEIKYK
jgi:uncharacterized phage protein (TIGR01671 family)